MLLAQYSLKRLPPCTFSFSNYAYGIPFTSNTTLDAPPPRAPSFESLLPPDTPFPLTSPPQPSTKGRHKSPNRRLIPLRRLPTLRHTPTTARPPPRPPQRDLSQISPYLPLVTRERNYLLSSLHSNLYSSPTRSYPWQPNSTWDALARVLRYPDLLPSLPPTHHPSSTRSTAEGHLPDPRIKIPLSLPELRRAFTVFASARPRTRDGLTRLLVATELLAQRANRHLPPAMEDGGRDSMLRELRGGGQGLREKDWRALILFVGTSLRSPRATPEVESAFSLFSQYMRLDEGTIGRDRTLKRRKQGRSAKIETYNALLHIAAKARSWELFENVEQRLASLGLQGDVYTVGIRMYKEDRRGAHVETVWNVFQEGLARFGAEEGAKLWNMMLWVLARRGMLKDAMRLYEVMRKGEPVDLGMLAPRDDPLSGDLTTPRATDRRYLPPPPEESTYARLIQAFAHRGDLNSALSIMRDMVSLSPPLSNYAPSTHIFTCLFRGFATYGFYPTPSDLLVSPRHLRGSPIRSNALASRESSFSPLSILGANRRSPTSPWSLSTLQSLFQSFLSLSPPSPPTYHLLPFSGQRTSPSAKELFWLVLAFEVLSGDDSELVLEVWKAVEETFGRGKRRDGVEAWTGWRADTRLRGKIERHQRRVEEWELERRELGE